jgi:chemotaxis signal transduction protein/nucleoid-associated protein YgaU
MSSDKTINDANALLVFSVGPVLCCAPTLAVETVMMPPVIHKTPGSDRNHPGVFRHSQGMVSVVDLRQRFGVEEDAWQTPGRIIVTEISGGHAGFLVDSILDVMLWPEQGWGAIPALVPREIFKRTLLLKNQIYLYADFEDLFRFRESGYLREHIAVLVEKQQQAAEKNNVHEASVTSVVSSQAPAVSQAKQSEPEKIASHTAVTETKPVQPSWTAASPERRVAPASNKKSESGLKSKPSATTNLRRHDDTIPKPKIKIPAFIEPSYKVPVTVTDNNKTFEPNEKLSVEQNNKPDTTSGKLIVVALVVAILVAIAFMMTSFNKPEIKTIDQPQLITSKAAQIPDVVETEPVQDYQARITQDAEGIVITIDTTPEDLLKQQLGTEPTNENLPAITTTVVPLSAPEVKTIVHIVVKGDTLWAIANRYVRDPWRYPELAKLSNIKNPHRIYPGNKVKIIMRATGKTESK